MNGHGGPGQMGVRLNLSQQGLEDDREGAAPAARWETDKEENIVGPFFL